MGTFHVHYRQESSKDPGGDADESFGLQADSRIRLRPCLFPTVRSERQERCNRSVFSPAPAIAENSLPLEANLRGTIEYAHPDGAPAILVILDRQSGKELFRKEYDDGSVYEYVNFSRYQLPLNRIAVVVSDAGSHTLCGY